MKKSFNPGSFKHKMSFLSPPVETDEYGERLDEWEPYKNAMASIEPILGKEFYTALTSDTKVEVKIRTRYIEGVTDTMRISHKDKIYEIISAIDVDTAHKELLCYCRQVK